MVHHQHCNRVIGFFCAAAMLLATSGCTGESEADLLRSARSFLDKGDNNAAVVQMKVLLQKNPQSGEARFLMGDGLLREGDFAGAAVELQKASDLHHGADRVLPLLAKALLGSGQMNKLTDVYAQVSLAEPKAIGDLKATLAAAYAAQGQAAQSEAAVAAALAADPGNNAARVLQARQAAGRGATDEALRIVDAVLSSDRKQAAAWVLKAQLLWVGKSDPAGAAKVLREALTVDPPFLPTHSTLLDILIQNGDLEGVRTQVAALKKAFPGNPDTLYYGAQLALADKDFERARQTVQQLLKVAPQNLLALELAGRIELQRGSALLAQSHFSKALQLAPGFPQARQGLAEAYVRLGQPAKALLALEPLLQGGNAKADVLALAGEAYLQTGDMDKAQTYFQRAATADPADTRMRTAVLLTQMSRGGTEAGMARLEALAAADTGVYADLALISVRLRGRDFAAAFRAIDRLQTKWPDKALPYQLRGSLQQRQGNAAAARTSFEKAAAVDAAYFPAVAALAALDLAENKPDAARKRFDDVLAREPGNFRALISAAELRQRSGAAPAEVDKLLSEAVKLNPSEATPRLMLIEHQLAQRDNKAALSAAQDAVAALPQNLPLLDALGRAQLWAGDIQQSISTFNRLADATPASPQPYLRLADVHLRRNDLTAAAQSLRRALQLSPNLPAAERGLAQIALAQKRPDDALIIARAMQKKRPDEAAGYLLEGEVQASQQRWDAAVAAFRTALSRSRSTELAVRLYAAYTLASRQVDAERLAAGWEKDNPTDVGFQEGLGAIALEARDFPRAETRYRNVVALRADDALALNNLAWLMLQQSKPGALPLAEKANRLAPDRAAIMDTLAAALTADGQLPKALEWQKKAVEKDASQSGYRLNLARLLLQANQRDAARVELEKLAKLGAAFPGQTEVAKLLKSI